MASPMSGDEEHKEQTSEVDVVANDTAESAAAHNSESQKSPSLDRPETSSKGSAEKHEVIEDEGDGDISMAGGQSREKVQHISESFSAFGISSADGAEDASGDLSTSFDAQTQYGRHQRQDSVPPQRYDLSSMTRTPKTARQVDADEEQELPRPSRLVAPRSSETEEEGLDFVDVSLGAMTHPLYGAGTRQGASRSALEIRQDSIASGSSALPEFEEQQQQQQQNKSSTDSSFKASDGPSREASFEPDSLDRALEEHTEKSRGNNFLSEDSADHSVAITPRRAEGRYRGRLSQPGSGASSPVPQSPKLAKSISSRSMRSVDNGQPAVSMTVVGEDGAIKVVPASAIAIESPEKQKASLAETGARQNERDEHIRTLSLSGDEPPTGKENGQVQDHGQGEKESRPADTKGEDGKVTSPTLTDAADGEPDEQKKKKRRESAGVPSTLEQHISRTRMMNLPPKSKQEDVRHLNDFEAMMKRSRDLEKQRQLDEEVKRIHRDQELQENMKIWERDILPSWTRARREGKLRKLWSKGIPPMLRGRLWTQACGNNQMLPRNLFHKASEEARDARRNNNFPESVIAEIHADIEHTLPTLRLFQKDVGALHEDLFEVLCAFTMCRMDQFRAKAKESNVSGYDAGNIPVGVYIEGTASLVAMLMINLSPADALIALINLIADKPWLRALYAVHLPSQLSAANGEKGSRSRKWQQQHPSAGFERVFDTLLADQWPKVYANMQSLGIRPSSYGSQWIRTLFVPYLPLEVVARLWDCILLDEGDALLFRIGIAIFSLLSSRLYAPDKGEVISILRGNNRASIAVWNRFRTDRDATQSPVSQPRNSLFIPNEAEEGEKSRDAPAEMPTSQDGNSTRDSAFERSSSTASDAHSSTTSREAPEEMVPRDDIYGGQYGITESLLFRTLEEQESWWKDSTLERLLDRELVS